MPSSDEPRPFRITLDPIMVAIAESRQSFERWLDDLGLDDGAREELAVVFSELVSNATRAAARTGDVPEIEAWIEPDSVVLEVSNPVAPGETAVLDWNLDDPLRQGGRGLMIVRAYTDDVSVTTAEDTLTVRCRRLLD
jgi:anti-sigma regulatory factor (Ser/Thr protein kinase)